MNIRRAASIGGLLTAASTATVLAFAGPALAQSGHFVVGGANDPTCTDIGTQVECSGKVAGLGGTTFEITLSASGLASVECENPGGNVAPGQDTEVDAAGSSGPIPTPRNGQARFTVTTVAPTVPNTPTCPNDMWTATVTDVDFTDAVATITLFEDGVQSDQITVPVS